MSSQKKKAFTLVELIVVITILGILATMAFIALLWYATDARNSSRISDLNHIKKSLALFSLATGKYPQPDNAQNVTYSWWTVPMWKQWIIGDTVTTQLSRNLNKKPIDPLYDIEYIYSTTDDGTKFEIMSLYEPIGTQNTVKIDWNYAWMWVKSWHYIIPTPSIITAENLPLDLDSTTIASQVISHGENIPNMWTNRIQQSTWTLNFLNFDVYNGLLDKDTDSSEFLNVYNVVANTYSGSSVEDIWNIETLLSKTTDDEKINFIKTIVLNTSSNQSSSLATTTYSCTWTLPSQNVSTSNNTWLTIDTAWQNTASWDDCYYECTWWYTWINCDIPPALITSTDCTSAWWIWVSNDVYIWTTQWDWFCISPRFWDWNTDSNNWDGAISFNGWWNYNLTYFNWWDPSSIDDTWNALPEYGQTKILDSQVSYTCKTLWTANSDYDTSDTIVWRMKWLATTWNNHTQAQNIDWITWVNPINGHVVPALYIADCIDWVKNLGTTMTYIHNNGTTDEVTYAEYSTDVSLNVSNAYLTNATYQNRQKYLIAWTQETGSHLPSAMSYITSWYASASDTDWDFLVWVDRWEYQVACELWLLTDGNDDLDNEWIRTSAIGGTTGTIWWRYARIIGSNGCWDQSFHGTGNRSNNFSARFIVRP